MKSTKSSRLHRKDWVLGAFELLTTVGVEGIKITSLAEKLGVTSGSFYWHFKNRRELYDALLDYWMKEMTDVAIKRAREFGGKPKERIWNLMEEVMSSNLALYDLAIWHWAQSDTSANKVFQQALEKRFNFAQWMFEQAGFSAIEAEARGRMMVVYMMGESTLISEHDGKRKKKLGLKFEVLTHPF